MVGIINPNDDKTLDDYRERASELASGVSPGRDAYGGEVTDSDDQDNDDSNDDNTDDANEDNDADDSDDDGNAAGGFKVPVLSLLSAVAVAFFMA